MRQERAVKIIGQCISFVLFVNKFMNDYDKKKIFNSQ